MADRFTSEVLALIGRDLLRTRLVKEVLVPSPPAGSEWSQSVPGGTIWEILSATFIFTPSAAVANRTARWEIRDMDGLRVMAFQPPGVQAANTSQRHTFLPGYGYDKNIAGMAAGMGTPPPIALPGWVLGSATSALDVGDIYTSIVLSVREWDETGIIQEAMELFAGLEEYIERGNREGSDY